MQIAVPENADAEIIAVDDVGRGAMRRRRYQIGDAHRFGTGALPVQLAENALDVAKRVAPVIVGQIAAAVVQRALDDETAPVLENVIREETPVQGRNAVCASAQIDVSAEIGKGSRRDKE